MNLAESKRFPHPRRVDLEGRYTRLEPLSPERHTADLFASAQAPGFEERFRYLFTSPPADLEEFAAWIATVSSVADPLFFAVVDRQTGRAEGRQALMRIDHQHGVVEVGNVLWGPAIARSRVATEALFLFARYVFGLGYRRLEWKCDNRNEPSKRAARRFGFQFEGVFRQHMIIKGENRDTAWFAITDADWLLLRPAYERWLLPENFDEAGTQREKLGSAQDGS